MKKTVAIIGCGPRGLSALEDLLIAYSKAENIFNLRVIIFERTGCFGSGQVYNSEQTSCNWLNISERALTLSGRKDINLQGEIIGGFPSYKAWKGNTSVNKLNIDVFPQRALLGEYLEARYSSISKRIKELGVLTAYQNLVVSVNHVNNQFVITDETQQNFKVDEVVLTLGHQPTKAKKQIENWKEFEATNDAVKLFEQPYPISGVFNSNFINSSSRVAIRGFGLAMIDVVRGLVSYTNSHFKVVNAHTQEMVFYPGASCPKKIIPFSLDGLPMAPKPLNKTIDNWFKPTKEQLKFLISKITKHTAQPENIRSVDFLVRAMATIIAEVFLSLENKSVVHNYTISKLENIIERYVKNDKTQDSVLVSSCLSVKVIMEKYVGMATGENLISLDYCIGQVWRHCQPTHYKYLSYNKFKKSVTLEIVTLDEKLKRLTFGPPVASLQQLLALINAGVMSVKAIDDPDIECTPKGWLLDAENVEHTANVMINSVLDAPKVLDVKTPLIRQLLESGYIKPIHNNLGVETCKNGIAKSNIKLPLAVLGRLAQGTLLGVDAILECFGYRSKNWAKAAVRRLQNQED
ncbi:FAD/NAD(P)-binding domain-containing protein [Postechiella marina]|uniref:FAD/NAD(P)-binding domain-containing protein n=1 Tax=Postechiella marina TaxID=943941 RepID=A0ABP8C2L0_9FLAO